MALMGQAFAHLPQPEHSLSSTSAMKLEVATALG